MILLRNQVQSSTLQCMCLKAINNFIIECSGRVWLEIKKSLVQALQEALRCFLEQDTLSSAQYWSTKETSQHNWKAVEWNLKHQIKQPKIYFLMSFSGASVFVILLHASLYTPDEEAEPFDLEMEEVWILLWPYTASLMGQYMSHDMWFPTMCFFDMSVDSEEPVQPLGLKETRNDVPSVAIYS